jgi:arginyl-tRNA--protein-N-Asp/Glu arginylyltransferase
MNYKIKFRPLELLINNAWIEDPENIVGVSKE